MFIYLIIALISVLLFYFKWTYTHWQRHGFPYLEAKIPFGVLDPVVRSWKKSFGMAIFDIYKQSKERILGIYLINRPALLIRDAQLARDILCKDFVSFHDRGIYVNEEKDPMSGGLFFLKGQKWKTLRTKLTPSFTSGKLKGMFPTIQDVSEKMVQHINTKLPKDGSGQRIETKKLFVTYAIDIIASSIFGLEVNSFDHPENDFFSLSQHVNANTFISVFRSTCQFAYPSLEKLFQQFGWTEKAPDSMKKLVQRTIEHREANNIVRKDLLQLLLQLRNTGKINDDGDEDWSAKKTKGALPEMSVELIAAQLFLFYVAGFETSAATSAFTLYELSKNPELLQRAQNDIEEALQKHDGHLSYEALKDMKFLDLCLMETTRKYPGLPVLNRECTQDYAVPDSKHIIKKGTPILISLFGIHRDEEYFPNAQSYDPDRFSEDYNTAAYMPFGDGPRHCIAQRMGTLNVKVAIAQVLTHFNIEINKNPHEIEIDNFGIPIMPKGGVPVTLSRKRISN